MKSLGEAALSGDTREVRELLDCIDLDDPGRCVDMSTDFGRVLLLDRVDSSDFCLLVGELSSRLVRVKTRLRGRERERLFSLLSSFLLESWDETSLVGLRALGLRLLSSGAMDKADDPLPTLSPLIRPALTSGFKPLIVSRIFTGTFSKSSTLSNAESNSIGLSGC